MTRINAGIPVERLTDQHLLAEHREIKRVTRHYGKIPPTRTFTLGKGHELFFANKPGYTYARYMRIRNECKKRGFEVTDFSKNWDRKPKRIHYKPTIKAKRLLRQRIRARIDDSNCQFRYYGKPISKGTAKSLLTNII